MSLENYRSEGFDKENIDTVIERELTHEEMVLYKQIEQDLIKKYIVDSGIPPEPEWIEIEGEDVESRKRREKKVNKDHQYIESMVMQWIQDNGANYRKAFNKLMARDPNFLTDWPENKNIVLAKIDNEMPGTVLQA